MPEMTEVLTAAVGKGASDVHLVVGKPPMLRVNGEMFPLAGAPALDADEVRRMIYSILYEDQRARFEADWELDCSFAVPKVSRFRVNVFQQRRGPAAVLRVISAHIPTPQEIGLMPSVVNLCKEARGLVLVTGPTGSGKTTTLASLIEHINLNQRRTIVTIEDPIEFTYEDKNSIILQREVGQQTKSFSEALRRAMRQDPDVILVGEMRDLETIALAITAAETGHLCFATLHTQDAPTSVDRMIDVFPPHQQQQVRVQVSTVLKAVVSQVLLARPGGTGRVCAREVMTMTPAVGSLIRDGKTHMLYGAIESGAKFGMISMDQYLAFLVKQNLVKLDDAMMKARDPQNLKMLMSIQPAQAS
ncbi:MAG: type IV pilus twitching motility protein PilT [Elusimicrobia bacterium]|nr:type IV pilus twitching motility protein PilT [Elusimicrobiota bacterium]